MKVGQLIGRSVGWSVGWLVGWTVCWLVGWSVSFWIFMYGKLWLVGDYILLCFLLSLLILSRDYKLLGWSIQLSVCQIVVVAVVKSAVLSLTSVFIIAIFDEIYS